MSTEISSDAKDKKRTIVFASITLFYRFRCTISADYVSYYPSNGTIHGISMNSARIVTAAVLWNMFDSYDRLDECLALGIFEANCYEPPDSPFFTFDTRLHTGKGTSRSRDVARSDLVRGCRIVELARDRAILDGRDQATTDDHRSVRTTRQTHNVETFCIVAA